MKRFGLILVVLTTAVLSGAPRASAECVVHVGGMTLDNLGLPVQQVSVAFRNIRSGDHVVLNSGRPASYALKLPQGRYTITYGTVGYERSQIAANIGNGDGETSCGTEQVLNLYLNESTPSPTGRSR